MWKFLSSFFNDSIRTNQLHALLRFGVNFLIGILLVRSFMSREEVGVLEYALFLAYTGSFVFTFAYSSAILSKIKTEKKSGISSELNQIFWQLAGISVLTGVGLYFVLKVLPALGIEFLDEGLHMQVSVLAGLIIWVLPAELYFILTEKAKAYFFYTLSVHGILLGMVIVALLNEWTLSRILNIYIAIQLLKFVVVLLQIKPRFRINFAIQKEWFLFTIPLIMHYILGSTMDYMDGHIVASYFDENQFLFYRYGARELPLSLILVNAISASFIPLLVKDINQLSGLKARIKRVMHFTYPMSIALLFVAPYLFQLVYGADFIVSSQVFNFYILVITSRILLPHTILYAKKDNMALVWFSAIEFVVNLGLSLALIRPMGITGVALATVIAFLVNRVGMLIYVKRKYSISPESYIPVRLYSVYTILLIIAFFAVQIAIYDNL